MSRNPNAINVHALSGAAAFLCVDARMTLGLQSDAGVHSPGEGDVATP